MSFNLNENLITSIQKICQNYEVDKLVLFGSRARGDNKLTSDVDIAVFVPQNMEKKGYFIDEFDNLNTLLKIDLVFIDNYTDKRLINYIERDGIIIYERTKE